MSVLREDVVDEEQVDQRVWESLDHYLQLLVGKAAFDFTELINLAVSYLETDPEEDPNARVIQDHIRDDISYVVVDEYQDVNSLQERLVAGLTQFGANLCVVGDDDQTVYQWRGSQVSNIVTFRDRYDGVRQVTLADNFRSSKGVVELARSVAERIPDGERLAKAMVSAENQQWERGDLLALTFDDAGAEASWICDRIEQFHGVPFRGTPKSAPRGLSWSDCAVLYRSVARDADPLVAEMRKRGIPYVVKGLNRLFDSVEIQAVVGIFRAMVGDLGASELRALWENADLLPEPARWHRAFEQIYFNTSPAEKYDAFVKWLEHQAPDYYAESDADIGYATPDAVTLATVHQAKGMQWPAVFIPCLRKNRFPSKRQGGVGLFHIIPDAAIADADRYRGTVADETRLFYVAVTRAQRYLAMTFSPGPNQLYRNRSVFFDHCADQTWVSTKPSTRPLPDRIGPKARHETPQVTFSFSELKYLFECPYSFKLRFLYGFNPPLHEALGYGKGLHDALAEVHKKAVAGELLNASDAGELVARHLHTPFALLRG